MLLAIFGWPTIPDKARWAWGQETSLYGEWQDPAGENVAVISSRTLSLGGQWHSISHFQVLDDRRSNLLLENGEVVSILKEPSGGIHLKKADGDTMLLRK